MAGKDTIFVVETIVLTILLFIPRVFFDDSNAIPADKLQLNSWFDANVKPLDARKDDLDPALVAAEANKTIIKNSAPRPDGKRELAQAAALRTGGDKASLYNCKMFGFQDTFCDDSGKHFFKDCYIEGTVDFIFGNGKSLYLNTEMHVIPGEAMAMVTAHARAADNVDRWSDFGKKEFDSWFDANVKPLDARKDDLDPALVAAEANKTIIKVRSDGSGDFKTLTDAINSIPEGNKRRVIISIGGGNYTEKVKIERSKPFITPYGDPKNNSAPRPDGKRELAQAAALRTGGDKASLYNCKMFGFQDTFCDDKCGKHFFKDCYIEGTVDFIFGNGKSLYLNTEMHVIPGEAMAMVTAHARAADNVDSGYSFVHCTVTGTGKTAYLGRAWKPFSKVVFSYSDLSDVVHPEGWSDFGKKEFDSWFDANVKPLDARKDDLDPALVAAEANKTIIKVRSDGSGDFKTLTDAINSIPEGNKRRVIISIGGGNYTEKVKIERSKPFITLAVNINFVNSAPRPDGKRELAQAAALRTGGDKASLYNCKMFGFQDTFCDDSGKHFFKDCYIEGTVDFIFGNGKSLYLNTEMHVIPGEAMAMVTAHARAADNVDSGYSFVHCTVTGTGKTAYLGRAWKPFSKVVFSYSDLSDVVHPEGWSDFGKKEFDSSVYYGEYNNKGAGATPERRVGYVKKLSDEEAKPFISLAYIEGSKWLLPPVTL
ncbi:hypothetical protein RND71_026067 [Anisodus tanguticus]|uniref:Pectinesterase n=1 Tax=Anisodus tanguticus TaxID=243964 RepID=A0AAE1V2I3_9SOLA|nr:hypothetical protein RND71_026067 [Anisodus tanguticus]